MGSFVMRRLIHGLGVVLGVSLVVFVLIRLSGDPAALFLPLDASLEEIQNLRHELGLDQPIVKQYVSFLWNAIRGDFGMSLRQQKPAMQLVLERLPATLKLAGLALGWSTIIGLISGVLSATHKGTLVDYASMVGSLMGQCMPVFWVGLVLMLLFSVKLGLLPSSGGGSLKHLILPSFTLGMYSSGLVARLIRSSLIEVLQSDYIRTARAKGLGSKIVLYKHALRNAAIDGITVLGMQMGHMLGGSIITECVFAFPGVGRLAYQAIAGRDFFVVQAFVVVTAVMMVIVNILVDVLYAWLDPRIVYS